MKKIIIYIPLFAALFVSAQNTSENYIKTTDCLSEDCSRKTETVQYFDFLGRPKQTVYVKATPQSKDLVLPIVYDESGKQTRTYLPVPQSSTANGASYSQSTDLVPFPVADATGFYGGEKIYTENIHEKSPLERILQQKNTGNAWNDKAVVFGYDVNKPEDHVLNFTVSAVWDSAENLYVNQLQPATEHGAATLVKNTATDEDGNTTVEFKNGRGEVILIRKILSASEKADTYYIYNVYGQLAYVVPPLAATSGNIDTTSLNNLCYQYRYDSKNRLAEKKIPGKGWELMVYDKQNRLILSQDAQLGSTDNNFNAKGWLFSKYDQFGRVTYTGFFANSSTRAVLQNTVNSISANAGNNEERDNVTPIIQNGESIYYTKNAFPTGSMTILTVNYYDTYPALPPGAELPASINGQPVLKQPGQNAGSKNTKSLPLASYVKNIEDNGWTKNYTYYDEKGRNIGSLSKNHLGGYTKTESELDFAGVTQKTKVYHKRLVSDTEKTVTQIYTYDHQNRLKVHKHQINGQPEEILAQNNYNEISQLASKKVGGTVLGNGLQTVDYQYNIRGWMTHINDPANLGNDLFGYEIRYNERKGLETPDVLDGSLKVKPKFNGNIAEIDWKTSTQENEPLKRYGYVYDGLNRLTAGFYQKAGTEASKEYFEKIEYDLNGNITRLKRSEGILQNGIALQVDNLKYDYIGNKLKKINDEQQNPSGYPYFVTPNIIEYDNNQNNGNGNMTKHLDKGISSIQYNFLNLPKQITQNAQVTHYVYRADGTKVKKFFGDIETNYLDGFQYKSTKSSEAGSIGGPILIDPTEVAEMKLRIIPTAEGYFDAVMNQYIYNYTDHLGNVRLSYSDTNKDGVIQPRQYNNPSCTGGTGPFDPPMCIDNWKPGEIVEVNSYYPFGLMHNYTATTQNAYQYKYNGKELQETGMYDYGARMYMPEIGRWGVSDPLAEALRRHTPYNYGVNNPVVFVDPDGRLSQSFIDAMMGSSGTYYNTGNGFSNGSDSFGFNGRGFASRSMSANFSFDSQISSFNELMGGLGGENSLSSWMQNYLNSTKLIGEDPVNFFGKSDEYIFHNLFKEVSKKFNFTNNDGVFRVFGHGNVGYMFNGNKTIVTAEQFDLHMNSKNSNWKNVDKLSHSTLILYTCLSASELNGEISMARKISQKHPNTTVIGFDGYISVGWDLITRKNTIKGINNALDSLDDLGTAVYYKNGKEINRTYYHQFKLLQNKAYPTSGGF